MVFGKLALGLGASLLLGACSDVSMDDFNPFAEDIVPPPCPTVRILADANAVTAFRDGPGRDLIDVTHEGKLTNIAGACQYKIDRETLEGKLTMEVAPVIAASRGPADKDRAAAFDYFVALFDDQHKLLRKETFGVRVVFEGNTTRLSVKDEPVLMEVPLKEAMKGGSYEVIVGFSLTKDQLNYNRRRGNTVFQ